MVGPILRCPVCVQEWDACECVSGMQIVEGCTECEAEREFCAVCGGYSCGCGDCGCPREER